MHLQHDVNTVRAECAWALTNALYKANSDSVKGIIDMGYFTASNYALELPDPRIVFVALEGINHALNAGLERPPVNGDNPFVLAVESCGLLDKIEEL